MTRELALAELATADAALARLRALLDTPEDPGRAAETPAIAAAGVAAGLQNPKAFYALLNASDQFGGTITRSQFEGIEADLALGAGRLPAAWMAYCLATDYHETGHTMQPVREKGNGDGPDADPWDDYLEKYDTGELARRLGNTPEADGDGIRWMGRGKPQVTGHDNYQKADRRLHALGLLKPAESLMTDPDLMLRMDVATAALVIGMLEGWYTGRKLNDYIPAKPSLQNLINARRIINGTDKAEPIAREAMTFLDGLVAGGWL